MTLNRRRLTSVLSILLCLLLAVGILKLAKNYREKLQAAENETTPGEISELPQEVSAYNSLTYYNGSTTLTFELDENGAWVWSADHAFPLDDTTLLSVLEKATQLELKEVASNPEDLDEYGLTTPSYTLEARGESAAYTLAFGDKVQDSDFYYVLENGDQSTVYTVAGDLLALMEIPIYDMMILPKLPELSAVQMNSVRIQGSVTEEGTYNSYTILTAQWPEAAEGETLTLDDVSWRANGANVTDDSTVQALLEDLLVLRIEKCQDYNPSADAADLCGFTIPSARLQVSYTSTTGIEEELVLYIGNHLPDGSGRYVRLGEEDPTLYSLTTEILDPLMSIAENGLENEAFS